MKTVFRFPKTEHKNLIFFSESQPDLFDFADSLEENTEDLGKEIERLEKLARDYDRLDDALDAQWITPADEAEKRAEQALILPQAGVQTRMELADKIRELRGQLK